MQFVCTYTSGYFLIYDDEYGCAHDDEMIMPRMTLKGLLSSERRYKQLTRLCWV